MSCVKITFMIKALHKYVDTSLDYFLIYYVFKAFYCTRVNVYRDVSVMAPEFQEPFSLIVAIHEL